MSATGDWSSADSTGVEAATAATSPFWWAPPAPPFLLCLDLASPSPIHPSAAGSLPDRMPPAIAASAPSTRIHFSGQPSHPSRSPVGETPLQGSCSAGQVTPEPPASGHGRTDHALRWCHEPFLWLGWSLGPESACYCSAVYSISQILFQFKNSTNFYKLIKYIENKIKIRKIQNKFPYNPLE
jgi:hypothetical protein